MTKQNKPAPVSSLFSHPFVIVLAAIVIAYAGYLFGVQLYHWLH